MQSRFTKCNVENHHLLLDENNASIATSKGKEKDSQLYISYDSDST